MARKMQTIYAYFSDYTEQEIDDMIYNLSIEEKLLIRDRYGDDLHNPVKTENWTKEKASQFYGMLVPKMKKLLIFSRQKKAIEQEELEKQKSIQEEKLPMLLQLINQNKSNTEICETLNINEKELYELLLMLKNKGMMICRNYYSDGAIKYRKETSLQELKSGRNTQQDKTIITDTFENNFRCLVISDLHFGNELERLDLIDRAYEYCIKNGIHIILCGGDLIDGSFTKGKQKIANLHKQIEYFIQKYPFDKSILTFSVAGDHDLSAFSVASLDIIEMCNNYRHDIIIGGYNNTCINLKNDQVLLFHHIENGFLRPTRSPIILHGHSHKYSTSMKDNVLNITIPSLSGINKSVPTALELDLSFSNGYIVSSVVRQIYLGKKDLVLGEATFDIRRNYLRPTDQIRNVENFKTEDGAENDSKTLSLVESFEQRHKI